VEQFGDVDRLALGVPLAARNGQQALEALSSSPTTNG